MNTARVSFQPGCPAIAAWLERGLCVSPAGKDSMSLVLLLNSASSQTSKWLLWGFFSRTKHFHPITKGISGGNCGLKFSALLSFFHHPPADGLVAVVPFQVPHAQVSSLLLCNARPCFAWGCGAWLPGAGGVHQSGGRLQTCPLVLVSLFDWFLWFLHHPLLWGALRTNWKCNSSWFMDSALSRNNQAGVVFCMCFMGSWWDGRWESCSAFPCGALPNVREELQKGVSPRAECCRDCDGESTKLSSRQGFPPAVPPHNCALDSHSKNTCELTWEQQMQVLWERCFTTLVFQSVTEHYRSDINQKMVHIGVTSDLK